MYPSTSALALVPEQLAEDGMELVEDGLPVPTTFASYALKPITPLRWLDVPILSHATQESERRT